MAQERYPPSVIPPLSLPSHLHQNHIPDHLLHGASPQAMHHFREGGDLSSFIAPSAGFPLSISNIDEMSRVRMGLGAGGATDLQTRSQVSPGCCSPYLAQYVRTPARFAFGERTVIVTSSKVVEKS